MTTTYWKRAIVVLLGSAALQPLLHCAEPLVSSTNQVAQYQKIEFTLRPEVLPANPHDPTEVAFGLEVQGPEGKVIKVPGFWFQPHEYQVRERSGKNVEWIYPVGPAVWRARFTPAKPGRYKAVGVLTTTLGESKTEPREFNCTKAETKGFVRTSRKDPRYFAFEDESPFFPLGHNLAFIGESQYLNVERAVRVFRKMNENGANFARIWTGAEDWALGIEARKSVWGRSWHWNPPIVPVPDRDGYHTDERCVVLGNEKTKSVTLSPCESVPLRAGTSYKLSGKVMTETGAELVIELGKQALGQPVRGKNRGQWTEFSYEFTAADEQWWLGEVALRVNGSGRVWMGSLSLRESGGGPELLWEADLNRQPRGFYNEPDCVMLDRLLEAAEASGVYLQLCLLTRDHYRHDLAEPKSANYTAAVRDAQKLLRYAVARWGYSPHVFAWEYFNEMDPNAPTERFHQELGDYLEKIDPYRHLRTTSGWGPAPRQWQHAELDIADLHWYLRPSSKPEWKDEVAGVLDRAALVRQAAPNKPAVLGEFGLADDKWGRSPHMAQDKRNVHFHNALWASALSGLSGAASFWWWEVLDGNDAYERYKPLSVFVGDIPFESGLDPVRLSTEGKEARVVMLKGKDQAYCWIASEEFTWWKVVEERKEPAEIKEASFLLEGVEPGEYEVQWWDTWNGKEAGRTGVVIPRQGTRLVIPNFRSDIACKIRRKVPRPEKQ